MANFKKFLNKKVIFVFVFVLILVVGGFFWWQNKEIKGSPEDYVIIKTEEGTFVENKKAGLLVKAPEGWEAEKISAKEGFVIFYPPYTEIEWQNEKINLPLKNGCIIDVSVVYEKMDFAEIKLDVRYALSVLGIKSQEFEEVIINDYPALKNIFDTQKIGSGMGVNIPYKNKAYSFYLYWAPEEKENCAQAFDSFLETISIK